MIFFLYTLEAILSFHRNNGYEIWAKLSHWHRSTIVLQWLEHLWNHENMFETEEVRANEGYHSTRSGGIFGIFFSILFNMKVCCVLQLESPHRGDSNECTQYTFSNIKQKIILKYPKSAAVGFFVRDSRTSLKQP